MKILVKVWREEYRGHVIRIEYTLFLSLKSSIRLVFDDVTVSDTPPRFEIHREHLKVSHMIDGRESEISLLIGYNRAGLKLIHQLKIDGEWVSGEKDFKEFYDIHMPDKGFLWYVTNKGLPAGVIYIVLMMLLAENITIGSAVFMFVFFSFVMSLMLYGSSRILRRGAK